MRSARVPLVAFVVAVSIATSGTGRADTVTAPFVPPGPVNPDVPPQASAAIIVLREACAAWQPATMPALPNTAGPMPKALGAPSERTLCAFAGNPGQALLQPMIMGGVAGAILFFIGLLVFSLLRAVLISVWNWRLPIGAKSW